MPHIFKKYHPWRNLLFIFGEGILIFLIINSVFIALAGLEEFEELFSLYLLRALVVTAVIHLCFYYFDLFNLMVLPTIPDHMLKVVQTFGLGCIILAFIYHLFPILNVPNRSYWYGLFTIGFGVFFWRFFYFKILERRMFVQPLAIVGTGSYAREIIELIEKNKDSGFKIVALVGDKHSADLFRGIPVLKDISSLRELCASRSIRKIVVAMDEKRGMPLHTLIQYKFLGIEIIQASRFYEKLAGKIPVEWVNPSWILYSEGFCISRPRRMIKRVLDVFAALFLLVITLPVFIACAVVIKLESSGRIFYRQERVGENGKIFQIIKFRSMVESAEQNGPVWAAKNDNRVTAFGRFIRKFRMDELPQLINVLKGDMSFVGPRPERPVFVEMLAKDIPYYNNRHIVKPGITGLAQIYYPYGSSIKDALRKLEYDLYYIKNLSTGIDLLTIFQTIKVVLYQKGSR